MTLNHSRNAEVANAGDVEADAVGDQSRSPILTIGFPIRVLDLNRWKFGGFLERCCYCKRRIAPSADVFMYGYGSYSRNLNAFCTAECREIQIAIDRMLKKRAKALRNSGVAQTDHKTLFEI